MFPYIAFAVVFLLGMLVVWLVMAGATSKPEPMEEPEVEPELPSGVDLGDRMVVFHSAQLAKDEDMLRLQENAHDYGTTIIDLQANPEPIPRPESKPSAVKISSALLLPQGRKAWP